MSIPSAYPTVGEIVARQPETARIFEQLGIDYCCGGKRPLDEACAERKLDAEAVLRMFDANPLMATFGREANWNSASLTELCDHIEATHHAYLKREFPRLSQITQKVAAVHGDHNPALKDVARVFEAFRDELTQHMAKEEQILFPMCRQLESSAGLPHFHCGSLRNPIAVMEREHTDAGDALVEMRRLTNDYTPPEWACNTYRVMLHSLQDLEADMHRHIHKENSILFPKAVALEQERSKGA